jgi:hypothetical protein
VLGQFEDCCMRRSLGLQSGLQTNPWKVLL